MRNLNQPNAALLDNEYEFQQDLGSAKLKILRESTILCTVLFAAFGILDFWTIPSHVYEVIIIRSVVVIFNLILIYLTLSSYQSKVISHYTVITCTAYAFWSVSIEGMILLATPTDPARYTYYTGLIMVLASLFSWTYLTRRNAAILATCVISVYIGFAIFFQEMADSSQFPFLISNCFFLVGANVIGAYSQHTRDQFARDSFRRKQELAHELQNTADANTAKSKFLAAASHDLRQPIHAQGLFLDVLARTELTPHQTALLNNARSASAASSDMLNALLDFSRIEAGVIEPQIVACNLQRIFHKIENDLAPMADAKNIVYRSRDTFCIVQTDPILLELILRNLVSNAIRYTQKGGVLVACRRHHNNADIEVWDTGIGIKQEDQKSVFREFHQLGNPERDRQKGMGLGLAIADGLARTMEHGLTLSSTPGRGSVFRLTLPLATNDALSEKVESPLDSSILENVRVLVIDDDEAVRLAMLHLLQAWGCLCEAAGSIDEALNLAQANPPDLIISDYRLRDNRTGVEAISLLRSLINKSLPALLITGDTASERLREAKASGLPILHKPVLASQLYQKLVRVAG